MVGQFLDLRIEVVDSPVTLGQHPDGLAVAIQERIGRPGQVLSDHGEQLDDLGVDSPKLAMELLSFLSSRLVLSHGQSLPSPGLAASGERASAERSTGWPAWLSWTRVRGLERPVG